MVRKEEKLLSVWVVRMNNSVNIYKDERSARKKYVQSLDYYRNHKPDDGDQHSYVVWHEVDEICDGGMHYALVDDYWCDTRKTISMSYFKAPVL